MDSCENEVWPTKASKEARLENFACPPRVCGFAVRLPRDWTPQALQILPSFSLESLPIPSPLTAIAVNDMCVNVSRDAEEAR